MSRNGGGVYSLPGTYEATAGETILAEQHNDPLEDLEQDANTARPIVAGGTGATTAVGAHDNFSTKGADVASAATTDIGAATGSYIHITGTTGITALGTKTAGVLRDVVFDGILTLTHNATSLILPGAANITTAAGDTARFRSEGAGNWRCVGYTRASGQALSQGEVIKYTSQTLTAAQQGVARGNISAALKGQIYGLTLSNNVSDATNDIDIAVGEAASTETDPVLMVLASALTKRLDGSWAVGTGNGGLDTGSIANTTYHVWLIQRSDTGVVDALFSASATAPTMPANYDRKRRIGSIIRASGAILPFTQTGDRFLLTTPILDVDVTNQGTTGIQRTLTVPLGLAVVALIRVSGTQANGWGIIINVTDLTPSITVAPLVDLFAAAAITGAAALERVTDTSGRVYSRATGASTTVKIATYGWIDSRGRLA